MICKNCSTEFDGKFCPECGAPAEEIEQVAEQVTEPAAEVALSVVDEPAIEEIADDAAEESVTPPATEQEDAPTAEPEAQGNYFEPETYTGCIVTQPKKKKTGLIVAIVVIVLAIAAFCVASFTDLFFSKQAQFVSILNNMGSDVSADFDELSDKNVEMKLSAKLDGESDVLADIVPKEVADLVNSLGLSMKGSMKGEDRADVTFSLFEGDKKLADFLAFQTKDAMYLKTDFSDVVVVSPIERGENDVELDEYLEYVKRELIAVLEKNEPVKGEYNGGFDLGTEVKALTVTLNESEINDTINKIIPQSFKTFGFSEIFEKPADGYGIKEISVSSLYSGAFSFARKSLGVSVTVKVDMDNLTGAKTGATLSEELVLEFIFYSNKENKAIYGLNLSSTGVTGGIYFEDNFEIKNGEQSGVVNMKTSGVLDATQALGTVTMPSVTYTIKKNSFDYNIRMVNGADISEVKFSAVRDSKGLNESVVWLMNSEEIGGFYLDMASCEPVSVDFDTSKAINITKDELSDDEKESFMAIVTDLQTLIDKNEDSVLLAMVGELLGGNQGNQGPDEDGWYPVETYMWDEYGIDHYATIFSTSNRAAYVAEVNGMYDVQEFGYDGDTIKQMTETLYIDVYGYTEDQQQSVLKSMEDSFAHVESIEDAYIYVELYDNYVVTTIMMDNLDNPQNLKEFISAGLISSSEKNPAMISFSQSAQMLKNGGYERVE